MAFSKTEEQLAIIDDLHTLRMGESLSIEAYAGCAKTTTIVMAIHSLIRSGVDPKDILYTSFQKSIVDESGSRLPVGVASRTFNSLAYSGFGEAFRGRLRSPTGGMIATHLGLSPINVPCMFQSGKGSGLRQTIREHRMTAAGLGYWLLNCVEVYCRSVDVELTEDILLAVDPIPDLAGGFVLPTFRSEMAKKYLGALKTLWRIMSDPEGQFPSTHGVYVKLWYLSEPILPYKYIFFDEDQDADPIMIKVIDEQPAKKTWMGDRYQQIYAWRGAVNAIDQIQADRHRTLSQTFRFGPELAEQANILLKYMGAKIPLIGFDEVETEIDPYAVRGHRAHIFRTNAEAVKDAMRLAEHNVPFVLNISSGMKSHIREIDILYRERRGTGSLALFTSKNELKEMIEYNGGNAGLGPLVELYEKHGADKIMRMVDSQGCDFGNDRETVILTNAHQCKGLEYDQTVLGDDFRHPGERGYSSEETRLAYVGMTRAKKRIKFISPGGCEGFTAAYAQKGASKAVA